MNLKNRCRQRVPPDERIVLQAWGAARLISGGPSWNGEIVLTERRIVSCQSGLPWLLRLVGRCVGYYEIELNGVAAVKRYPAAHTASMDIILRDGTCIRFGIAGRRPLGPLRPLVLPNDVMNRWATEIEARTYGEGDTREID